MKLLKALAVSLLMLVAPASATTYWVSQTATGGKSGADSTTNAMTLAEANAAVSAGDIVRFRVGNGAAYTSPIAPGAMGTGAGRIFYYGWQNAPTVIKVTNIDFDPNGRANENNGYFTVKWVETAELVFSDYYAEACSLLKVKGTAVGGLAVYGTDNVLDSLTVTGTQTDTWYWTNFGSADYWQTNVVVKNSTFNPTVESVGSSSSVRHISRANDAQFRNNAWNVVFNSCPSFWFGDYRVKSTGIITDSEAWTVTFNGIPGGSKAVWQIRDDVYSNRYSNNTITTTGTGNAPVLFWNSGSPNTPVAGNRFVSNTFKISHSTGTRPMIDFGEATVQDTFEFNTIVTDEVNEVLSAGDAGQVIDGLVFRHNTIVSAAATLVDLADCTFSNASGNPTKFASNIFYSTAANGSGDELVKLPANGTFEYDSAGVFFARGGDAAYALDRGGVDATPGDFAFGYSVWGSPRFADSTYATFNGSLLNGSYAVNSIFPDKFAGARRGLQIINTYVPLSVEGVTFDMTFGAIGGVEPYTWTHVAGSIPGGTSLDSGTGRLSGLPSEETAVFTIQVEDAEGSIATKEFTAVIMALGTEPSPSTGRRRHIFRSILGIFGL